MNSAMRNCQQIIELLDAYYDEELLGAEKSTVENHLAGCESCQKHLKSIRRLVQGIKTIRPTTASRDFADSIDFNQHPDKTNIVNFPGKAWTLAGIAAAVALIVIIANHGPLNSPRLAIKPNIRPQTKSISPVAVATVPAKNSTQYVERPDPKGSPQQAAGISKNAERIDTNTVSKKEAKAIKTHPAPAYDNIREEIAAVPEIGNLSCSEALGIATDEDGLYEIKI